MLKFRAWFRLMSAHFQYVVISIACDGEPFGIFGPSWARYRTQLVHIAAEEGVLIVASPWFYETPKDYKVITRDSSYRVIEDLYRHMDETEPGRKHQLAHVFDQQIREMMLAGSSMIKVLWSKQLLNAAPYEHALLRGPDSATEGAVERRRAELGIKKPAERIVAPIRGGDTPICECL